MKTFYKLLGVALAAVTANNFVWFALTYWAYLTTNSVVSTSIVAGLWLVAAALSGVWFGSIVDHSRKKRAMLGSSGVSFLMYAMGLALYLATPPPVFASFAHPQFWLFVLVLLGGVISGTIYAIAIPTLVATLVPEDRRDRANGLFGTVMGVSFALVSVVSGFSLAFGGMVFVLVVALAVTALAMGALALLPLPEREVARTQESTEQKIDLAGTIRVIRAVPGLFPLIFFTTFNNFLGGVFMALMDAYGLSLMSVEAWGLLWGFLSLGFIFGGLYVAKKGLGPAPVRRLFLINIAAWVACIFFTVQPSIVLLAAGILVWITLAPFVEATEQTIFQRVVPVERLGRVFGFAHSVEQATSPVTAFLIGPLAQYVFIPFMTTGAGVELIGGWFGVGPGRGIALVFIVAGVLGLIATLLAMRSESAQILAERFNAKPEAAPESGR